MRSTPKKKDLAEQVHNLTVTLEFYDQYLSGNDQNLSNKYQTKQAAEYGCFHYIPYGLGLFLTKMHQAHRIAQTVQRKKKISFLDVGSGIGTKVFLASSLFSKADGIEFDIKYLKTAKEVNKLADTNNVKFSKRDALKFRSYSEYDVIYLYRPFIDSDKQTKLEEKIARDAKKNSVIVGAFCNFGSRSNDELQLQEVFDEIHLKSNVKGRAEKIRTELLKSSRKSPKAKI